MSSLSMFTSQAEGTVTGSTDNTFEPHRIPHYRFSSPMAPILIGETCGISEVTMTTINSF